MTKLDKDSPFHLITRFIITGLCWPSHSHNFLPLMFNFPSVLKKFKMDVNYLFHLKYEAIVLNL